jgi:hypothetical protein
MLLLILLLSSPVNRVVTVDRLEINTHLDCQGNACWTQAIYWDFDDTDGEYHVRDWRIVEREPSIDRRGQFLREIYGGLTIQIREPVVYTATHRDPERADQRALPMEMRRRIF